MKTTFINFLNKESVNFRKLIYASFSVLTLSKVLVYEQYYDKMKPYSAENDLELHHTATDPSIISFQPINCLIEDLKHFKWDFDFIDLDQFHELYAEEMKKSLEQRNWKQQRISIWRKHCFQTVNDILLV